MKEKRKKKKIFRKNDKEKFFLGKILFLKQNYFIRGTLFDFLHIINYLLAHNKMINSLQNKGINILYYSPDISLQSFKEKSDIILVNRYVSSFDDVKEKVYTRDVFKRD